MWHGWASHSRWSLSTWKSHLGARSIVRINRSKFFLSLELGLIWLRTCPPEGSDWARSHLTPHGELPVLQGSAIGRKYVWFYSWDSSLFVLKVDILKLLGGKSLSDTRGYLSLRGDVVVVMGFHWLQDVASRWERWLWRAYDESKSARFWTLWFGCLVALDEDCPMVAIRNLFL